ncbi:MAG: double-strand break repair helicase AddA [Roseinatronobacter sp.]
MRFDDATEAQNRASSPMVSTWLSANAGSGKTKVLTDRVARLLLRGVEPQRILCLTYTKAAASEMQNRLFRLLGGWAMLPEPDLRNALAQIDEQPTGGLPEARRLFARAIESPGGLKIQTIHSFCAALLRRFPLEAGLSPAFAEMDDRSARMLRADVLDALAEGTDRPALDALAAVFTGSELDGLLQDICSASATFTGALPEAELRATLGLASQDSPERLLADVFLGGEFALLDALVPLMAAGSVTDVKIAAKLRAIAETAPDMAALEALEGVLLTGATAKAPFSAKIGSLPTKATQKTLGALMDPLEQLMVRVESARPRRLALECLTRSVALHRFARAFLPAYAQAKAARGWLDFDDLIARAGQLLTDPSVAQWVLFKLDGGVDHILVDEAQDTSPGQWRVIEHLAQEFTAGIGAVDASRTLFVVGDKKQSIYSFQGADLRVFDAMQAQFREALAHVDLRLNEALLAHSFRSSDAILRMVDATFRPPQDAGLGGAPAHVAFKTDLPGRVDLWPVIPKGEKVETPDWDDPVDILPEAHHTRQLARAIAHELRRMIDARVVLPVRDGPRAMTEGDVLILVRRRSVLFHEIIAACKAEGLRMAGADRLRLGGELAVRDLTALLAFLATPEDDLSLAGVLRSPLFGWSEDRVFRLAHGRGGAFLWARLRETGDAQTLAVLRDLRAQADFLRPFDLLERCLTRHDGRRRLIARLGPEAEEGIDALLGQALAYEPLETPSLTGFLAWLEQGDVQIKRELASAEGRLRVMTVHGAKGLEAPIVILPDTGDRATRERGQILQVAGLPFWRSARDVMPEALQTASTAETTLRAEEDARLLYVAMTRAEHWLIVAGAGDTRTPDAWFNRMEAGLRAVGGVPTDMPTGPGLRHEHGVWPVLPDTHVPGETQPGAGALPPCLWQPAAASLEQARLLLPSQLGGAKALPGEANLPEADALARGTQLHLLLEHLPLWPQDRWRAGAQALLDATEDGLPADLEALLAEAAAVVQAPELAEIFAPGTRAEVEITADLAGRRLFGVIDRLVVGPQDVLAVDFKSNRHIPAQPDQVPEGVLRQMGAYRAALGQVFPGREIRVALLWTAAPVLMALPAELVDAALLESRPLWA